MNNSLERILHFHLDREFPDYPRELVHPACHDFEEVAPFFCADIRAKFPSFTSDTAILQDISRLMQADIATFAIFLYRMERQIFLANPENALLPFLSSLMRIRTGAELYYSTAIGPGFNVQHGVGTVIGPRNVIGKNFMIHQGVTIGQQRAWSPDEKVSIGDHVILFAGSKVFGNITIGDNVWVGANALVIKSLEANGVYGGIPAQRIRDLPPKEE